MAFKSALEPIIALQKKALKLGLVSLFQEPNIRSLRDLYNSYMSTFLSILCTKYNANILPTYYSDYFYQNSVNNPNRLDAPLLILYRLPLFSSLLLEIIIHVFSSKDQTHGTQILAEISHSSSILLPSKPGVQFSEV